MRVLVAISLLLLAACGADGDPVPPGGVAATGDAQVGVVGEL